MPITTAGKDLILAGLSLGHLALADQAGLPFTAWHPASPEVTWVLPERDDPLIHGVLSRRTEAAPPVLFVAFTPPIVYTPGDRFTYHPEMILGA